MEGCGEASRQHPRSGGSHGQGVQQRNSCAGLPQAEPRTASHDLTTSTAQLCHDLLAHHAIPTQTNGLIAFGHNTLMQTHLLAWCVALYQERKSSSIPPRL